MSFVYLYIIGVRISANMIPDFIAIICILKQLKQAIDINTLLQIHTDYGWTTNEDKTTLQLNDIQMQLY
jgi:hypothetical protein